MPPPPGVARCTRTPGYHPRAAPRQGIARRSAFAYAYGARYLNHVSNAGGTPAIADVWASPPTTTQAFFASHSAVVEPGFDPVEFETLIAPGRLEPAFELTLGAWGLFVLLAKHGATFEAATEVATAWRGDRYFSYERDNDAAAVWMVELSDAGLTRDVALELQSSTLRAQAAGTTLTLGVGDPALPVDWAFDP